MKQVSNLLLLIVVGLQIVGNVAHFAISALPLGVWDIAPTTH